MPSFSTKNELKGNRVVEQEEKEKEEEDDDDYMTMTFAEPVQNTKSETLTQRKKRLALEAERRGHTKSKAQVAEEEKVKRDTALDKSTLDTTSKGFKMMASLGYKPGTALGVDRQSSTGDSADTRLLEPVGLEMKEDKSGIGADAEKKRKIREAFERQENAEKKRKVDEGDFRERQQQEREEKKMEGQLWGAMKVAERLDEDEDMNLSGAGDTNQPRKTSKPLSSVNVLWRELVKDRAIRERDRRMRYDLHQSLSRLPTYEGPEEDKNDKLAMNHKHVTEEVDLSLDEEDPELDEHNSLSIQERLEKLLLYLRNRWHYCFWCKYRYPDEAMEGCPGLTEDDHD